MFDVYEDDIKILFDFFNELNNTIFDSQENSVEFSGAPENKLKFIFLGDTEDKLNWYIQNQQVINQKGKKEKDYLLIQVIKKILFVINNYHKKYYINNIGFTFLI